MLFIVLPSRHFKCTLSPLSLIIQQQKRWRGEILADLAPSPTTLSTPVHIPGPGTPMYTRFKMASTPHLWTVISWLIVCLFHCFISNPCQTKRQEPEVWGPWGWWRAGGQNRQWSWQVGFPIWRNFVWIWTHLVCFSLNLRRNSQELKSLLQSESFWEQLCDHSKGTATSGYHCFSSGETFWYNLLHNRIT